MTIDVDAVEFHSLLGILNRYVADGLAGVVCKVIQRPLCPYDTDQPAGGFHLCN